jgi:hypothetical protein
MKNRLTYNEDDADLQEAINLSLIYEDEDLQEALKLSMVTSEEANRMTALKDFQQTRQKAIVLSTSQSYNAKRFDSDVSRTVISQLSAESLGNFYMTSKTNGTMILKAMEMRPFRSISFRLENAFIRLYQSKSPLSLHLTKSIENIRIMYSTRFATPVSMNSASLSKTSIKYLEFFINDMDQIEPIVRRFGIVGIRIIFYRIQINGSIDTWKGSIDCLAKKLRLDSDDYSLFSIPKMHTQTFIDNYKLIPNPPNKGSDLFGICNASFRRYMNK